MMTFDFFDWLNLSSTGERYMNKLECSRDDLNLIIGIAVTLIGIVVQYSIVAYHHWSVSKKYNHTSTKKYLLYFTGVFVFCMSTYLYDFISIWWASYKVQFAILLSLNIITAYFIKYMYRTRSVSKMNEAAIKVDKRYDDMMYRIETKVTESFSANMKNELPILVTYKEMLSLEEGKRYPVMDKSWFILIDKESDPAKLLSYVAPGEDYKHHYHDYYEKLVPIDGDLVDLVTGDRYITGDEHFLTKGDKHYPSSKNGCLVWVYFSETSF